MVVTHRGGQKRSILIMFDDVSGKALITDQGGVIEGDRPIHPTTEVDILLIIQGKGGRIGCAAFRDAGALPEQVPVGCVLADEEVDGLLGEFVDHLAADMDVPRYIHPYTSGFIDLGSADLLNPCQGSVGIELRQECIRLASVGERCVTNGEKDAPEVPDGHEFTGCMRCHIGRDIVVRPTDAGRPLVVTIRVGKGYETIVLAVIGQCLVTEHHRCCRESAAHERVSPRIRTYLLDACGGVGTSKATGPLAGLRMTDQVEGRDRDRRECSFHQRFSGV